MKLLIYVIVFAAGAASGVVWGVHHPDEAATEAAKIQAEVASAKIELLQKLQGTDVTNPPDYKKLLDLEKQKLSDAKQQLGN